MGLPECSYITCLYEDDNNYIFPMLLINACIESASYGADDSFYVSYNYCYFFCKYWMINLDDLRLNKNHTTPVIS